MSRKDKKMDIFVKEAFRLGALRGFRHFQVELRGREELILTVWPNARGRLSSTPKLARMNTQDTLPPASPYHREVNRSQWEAVSAAVFLIGSYAHYAIPYVWVRAGHSLIGFSGSSEHDYDAPIKLHCTELWAEQTVHVWDVVAELVCTVAAPAQSNPFELELSPLERMAPMDALLMNGALAAFLREVYMAASPLSSQVESEMLYMLDRFTRALHTFAISPEVKSRLMLAVSSEMRQLSRKSSGRHSEREERSPLAPRHSSVISTRQETHLSPARQGR